MQVIVPLLFTRDSDNEKRNILNLLAFRKPVYLLLLFLSLVFTPSITWADEKKKHRFSALSLQPYGIVNGDRQEGIYADILKKVVIGTSLQAHIDVVPIKRLISLMKQGDITCSILFRVKDLEKWFEPIAKIGKQLESVVFYRNGMSVTNLTDLENRSMGLVNGISLSPKLSDNKRIQKYLVKNYETGVRMLDGKRFDAIVGTRAALVYAFLEQKIDPNTYPEPYVFDKNELYLMCRKDVLTEGQKNELRQNIHEMRESGFITNTWNSYLVNEFGS